MTDDLVKRLREMCGDDGILAMRDIYDTDVAAAADRIERLEGAVRDLVQYVSRADLAFYTKTETRLVFRKLMEKQDD